MFSRETKGKHLDERKLNFEFGQKAEANNICWPLKGGVKSMKTWGGTFSNIRPVKKSSVPKTRGIDELTPKLKLIRRSSILIFFPAGLACIYSVHAPFHRPCHLKGLIAHAKQYPFRRFKHGFHGLDGPVLADVDCQAQSNNKGWRSMNE